MGPAPSKAVPRISAQLKIQHPQEGKDSLLQQDLYDYKQILQQEKVTTLSHCG